MAILFFSYSHRDETLRDELEIHLSQLKREGTIDVWHDRRISAGKEFAGEISQQLEQADIVLLLVSPYFLASDYCYDKEMTRALERHEQGEARVIPVILHPCDWKNAPFGKLLAVPQDGKPVSKYPNQHDAFLEVVQAVRKAAEELVARKGISQTQLGQQPKTHPTRPQATSRDRSSNLRIKKEFSDHERDIFRDESFEYIANYFENSLAELKQRNPEINTRFRRVDAHYFTASIYANGQKTSECGIWMGGDGYGSEITYSMQTLRRDGGYNEAMSVADDGYALFLKPLGMAFMGTSASRDKLLSQQGAAEYFWEILIRPLRD